MNIFKKLWFYTFLIGGVLGLGAGAGGMLVAFPYLFPPAVMNEPAPLMKQSAVTTPIFEQKHSFRFNEQAKGRDKWHWANGTGLILKSDAQTLIRLESEFDAAPGPNYWIYLNKNTAINDAKDFLNDNQRIKIAKLRAFKGGQNYSLPAGLEINDFKSITIWCETFGAYISSADLL
jgi:Electron transfer DM13